jgi:arginine-tRNA-protein transferase
MQPGSQRITPDFLLPIGASPDQCVYLPEQTALMPFYFPKHRLTPEQTDTVLELGFRRSGNAFYRTECPACRACEPLRIDVHKFVTRRSHKRLLKRALGALEIQIGAPELSEQRVALYNLHRDSRGLGASDRTVDDDDYLSFLVTSCVETVEVRILDNRDGDSKLVAVALTDCGNDSLSAVYCYFDPAYSRFSPGTLAILQQIHIAQTVGCRWLYLGMYVAANAHLNYKANFLPHQRRINGQWVDFGTQGKSSAS